MKPSPSVVIVGSGVFGLTAALSLRRRGYEVTVLDPGPLPHPLAASTDISKVVRLDYGSDETYTELMELALPRWRSWNAAWGEQVYHETGIIFLRREPLEHGGLEHDSFELLRQRGHPLQRLNRTAIAKRFPAWDSDRWVDGYLNPAGGYAESSRVIVRLVEEARQRGAVLRHGVRCTGLRLRGSQAIGVVVDHGDPVNADWVVVAAGAWTPSALPELAPLWAGFLRTTGQPVFHLQPASREPYEKERFPVFGAELAVTGYYGFPVNRDGIVKIARHGPGRVMHPESPERVVLPAEEAHLRAFLAQSIPGLVDAPLAGTRLCMYCDTLDGDFLIGRVPAEAGLERVVVASGDSGHGFKFAPVLGDLIADAVQKDQVGPALRRFGFRAAKAGTEAARAAQ